MTEAAAPAGAAPAAAPRRSPLRFLGANPGVLIALGLLLIFNVVFTPNFLSVQAFNVNATQVATIAIVATGMTLVIATGGVDLSVGALMAIAGALAPLIFMGRLLPVPDGAIELILACLLPLLAVGLLGAFNGWLITRFDIQPIIATLVLFIAGRGIAQVLTNGNLQVFRAEPFQWIGLGRVLGIPVQVIVVVIVTAIVAFVLRRTVFGRQLLAVGGNEKAARLAGVPVKRVKIAVYAISGVLAGVAGFVVISINSSADANLIGLNMELDAIAAVLVGGTLLTGGRAYVVGTLVGAVFIQLVRFTLLAHGVPDAAAMVVKAAIILAAVYLQRHGRRAG